MWLTLLFGLLLTLIARELLQVLTARAPQQPRSVVIGAPSTSAPIPKVIWTYWQSLPPPDLVVRCLANWQRMAPDHELRFLDRDHIAPWLDTEALDQGFDSLPSFRQADWLRVQLLARHGGIWIDASTVLTCDLGWMHTLQADWRTEYVGFYIARFTSRPELPIVENWFMAAAPGCRFVADLAREFDIVLQMGEPAYSEQLRKQGRFERVVQNLDDQYRQYLIMHLAAASLLDANPQRYSMVLLRAEDTALSLHAALGWRKRHLYARMALTPCPASTRLPFLVKLRGGDRRVTERGLARGWVLRNSFLARYLELAP
jgi:uncharacterized membrane-anchored protein YhcB (DUF1043 family)